jgi:hypothetical protein
MPKPSSGSGSSALGAGKMTAKNKNGQITLGEHNIDVRLKLQPGKKSSKKWIFCSI